MIILDTNVLSALMLMIPDRTIVAWLDMQPEEEICTTSITVLELKFGIEITAAGKRRSQLQAAFQIILDRIAHRVLPFDEAAAEQAADLMAVRKKKGQPRDFRDTMIAGIVLANRSTLATRNTAHFHDLTPSSLIDPWKS